jgi:spore coat polysaccharide biosynthesis protein SpsF
MKTVLIIQARMGSTRLPGKVLASIGGQSMLARTCRRAARATLIDEALVATSVHPQDDPIEEECRLLGLQCFRGSEEDVLDRYYSAAEARRADLVVRVTSDCPLIDPEVIDRVIGAAHRDLPDYTSNVLQRTYPRGLDTEVVPRESLQRAWREAAEPYQRVHVMPYFYQNPDRFRLRSVTGDADFSHYRWTVDSAEDLALARALYRRMDCDDAFSWRDVIGLLHREPRLAEINGHVQQKQLVEG